MRKRALASLISSVWISSLIVVGSAHAALAAELPCGTNGVLTGPVSGVYTCTYTATGPDTFTLKPTVDELKIVAVGGKGGDGWWGANQLVCHDYDGCGGYGANNTATVLVVGGQSLDVFVAGNGADGGDMAVGGGGYGMGGAGGGGWAGPTGNGHLKTGGGGGGASSVSRSSEYLVIAGGGGGGGYWGGDGGAANEDGRPDVGSGVCDPGLAGTLSAGGAGGKDLGCGTWDGYDGAMGQGGLGSIGGGGGGGGGYFGGGGSESVGQDSSGAGGGSSYPDWPVGSPFADETGVPLVTISWSLSAPGLTGTVYNAAVDGQIWAGTETDGARANASAVITRVNDVAPTGSVTYDWYSGSACGTWGSVMSTDTQTIDDTGYVPFSGATAPLPAGDYSLKISYSGDSNYQVGTDCENFTVLPAAGVGTMVGSLPTVSAGAKNQTIAFTFTVGNGGMNNGQLRLTVPSGWSAPSTSGSAAGFVKIGTGTLSISTRAIVVSNVTAAPNDQIVITYGSRVDGGPGATAPLALGAQSWKTEQRSTSAGSTAALPNSPSIAVMARDGSGTIARSPTTVAKSSTRKTITFTYTVASGGMYNGTLRITVPSGWSAPSKVVTAKGYVTSSVGTVTTSDRRIIVSGITLSGGALVVVVYGGGAGANTPSTAMTQTWSTRERSTPTGTLLLLAIQPTIKVQ